MQKITLGKTGLEVTKLGFGGIPIQTVSHEEAVAVVSRALELGINFFDTARAYTTSEAAMGEALALHRDKVLIASKTQARVPERVAEELAVTLKNLRTDYLDLYQLHMVVGDETLNRLVAPGGAVEYLLKRKEEGTIRHLGLTSHRLETAIRATRLGVFETVQFPFNYIEDEALVELYPTALENGVGVIAMKPLAGGALNHLGAAIRWCLTKSPGVIIPGAATTSQLEENLAAASKELSDEDLALLEQDKEELGPTFCRRCRYCMPCPNHININFIITAELLYRRAGWQRVTQQHLDIFATGLECKECGECEEKCPYNLPLTTMVRPTAERMLDTIKQLRLHP